MTDYRKDIQILRGVAVLLVVLFHLGVGAFKSGFLGVDVFFVVSGYLMAVLYDPRDKAEFFRRRARRLLPAYFATILATLAASILIVTPNDFRQVASQSEFSAFFAANLSFWAENSYFDKAAFKPLLHLWSLGVEIQFYVLIPLIVWFIRRTGKVGFALLAIGSAAACFLMVLVSPKTSFFLLPFRLWQFLMGYACATFWKSTSGQGERAWAGFFGLLVLVAIPFIPVDGEARNLLDGHPALGALIISAATMAVLHFGLPRSVTESRVIAPLERLGDYSYSVYLAHFPVLVLLLYKPFSGTFLRVETAYEFVCAVLLIALGSGVLYQFVEKPFRKGLPMPPKLAVASIILIGVLSVGGSYIQGLRLSPAEQVISAAWTDRTPYRCGKLNRLLHPTAKTCLIGAPMADPKHRIMLVGNSHADSIKQTFVEEANQRKATVLFVVDNDPLFPGGVQPNDLIGEALIRKVDALVLHYSPGVPLQAIQQLASLASARGLPVAFIMPVPVWQQHVPKMLWTNLKSGEPVLTQSIDEYRAANSSLVAALSQLQSPLFRIYSAGDSFCSERCRLTDSTGRPLYFDAHHLTLTGSNLLRPLFRSVLAGIDEALANRGGPLPAVLPIPPGNRG